MGDIQLERRIDVILAHKAWEESIDVILAHKAWEGSIDVLLALGSCGCSQWHVDWKQADTRKLLRFSLSRQCFFSRISGAALQLKHSSTTTCTHVRCQDNGVVFSSPPRWSSWWELSTRNPILAWFTYGWDFKKISIILLVHKRSNIPNTSHAILPHHCCWKNDTWVKHKKIPRKNQECIGGCHYLLYCCNCLFFLLVNIKTMVLVV